MRQLFSVAGFPRLFTALTISQLGDSIMLLVMGIWVKELTGSNGLAGLTFLFLSLPSLFAPVFGVYIDRLKRKAILTWGHLASGFAVLPLLAVRDAGDVWIVYVCSFLYGISFAVLPSASSALYKDLLPEEALLHANTASTTAHEGFRLIGPLIGAALYAAFGGYAVALIDAVSFVVAAALIASLKVAETAGPPSESHYLAQLRAGWDYLWHERVLRHLTIGLVISIMVIGFFESAIYALMDAMDKPATWVSVLISVQGIGAIAGAVVTPYLAKRWGELTVLVVALVACGVLVTPYAFTTALVPILACTIGFGAMLPPILITINTLYQKRTPAELMGRVDSVANVAFSGPQILSLAVGAVLVSVIDYRFMYAATAIALVASGIYVSLTLRKELGQRASLELPASEVVAG